MRTRVLSIEEASEEALRLIASGDAEKGEALARRILAFPPIATLWADEAHFRSELSLWFKLKEQFPHVAEVSQDREFGFKALPMGALTLTGEGNGLGSIRFGNITIPTFGPQWAPWSHSQTFGISMPPPFLGTLEERRAHSWIRTKQVDLPCWIETIFSWDETHLNLKIRAIGKPHDRELGFAFYLAAPNCRVVNGPSLELKSLKHIKGPLQEVRFGELSIALSERVDGEIIPLAGQGCFWNATYLFVSPLRDEYITYTISKT